MPGQRHPAPREKRTAVSAAPLAILLGRIPLTSCLVPSPRFKSLRESLTMVFDAYRRGEGTRQLPIMGTKTVSAREAAEEPVFISRYDPEWPRRFEAESARLRALLPHELLGRIEHFGSTAVPGLAAKPVVDMLVEVPSLETAQTVVAPILAAHGYTSFIRPSWKDPERAEYIWFIKRDEKGLRTHHIHMLEPDSPEWERLLFRDYLIEHPELAAEYGALKCQLAQKFPHDRIGYAKAKTAFITRVTDAARRHYRGGE